MELHRNEKYIGWMCFSRYSVTYNYGLPFIMDGLYYRIYRWYEYMLKIRFLWMFAMKHLRNYWRNNCFHASVLQTVMSKAALSSFSACIQIFVFLFTNYIWHNMTTHSLLLSLHRISTTWGASGWTRTKIMSDIQLTSRSILLEDVTNRYKRAQVKLIVLVNSNQ